ncbi:MAG: TrkH family potassium uptake protein [Pseudomonadales bacterium]
MHLNVILGVTGTLLMLFSLTLLTPILVAVVYVEDTISTFTIAFAITLGIGFVLWKLKRDAVELRNREGFLVTVLFYLGLGLFGALPLSPLLGSSVTEHFTDAAFESFSGLTTTGATILTGLDELPRSVLFYRAQLQWLGGMGIIVLAVAILPMLGVGGMQLYRAETPGPVKDTKLKPRITETAKSLWYLYLGITLACAVSYRVAGMDLFDAICHAFSTVAIGGFSTHDASLGFFDNPAIEGVAIVFMVLAGINFTLHFGVLQQRRLTPYIRDIEVRLYLAILVVLAIGVAWILDAHPEATARPIRDALFQAVSIATTTGYTTANFSAWPSVVPFLLLFAAFAGGCAGSTAGGIKIYRVLLIFRQGLREMRRLVHPNGIFHIKMGHQIVADRVVDAVWGFFAVYLMFFLGLLCALLALSDLDFVSAFSAIGACLNNLGPGLGDVAHGYQALPTSGKWILIIAMLLGRLEIFTLLVLLTPDYWRS